MSDVTNELLLEHLKAIQGRLVAIERRMIDHHQQMSEMNQHFHATIKTLARHEDNAAFQQAHIDRIERLLDLTE